MRLLSIALFAFVLSGCGSPRLTKGSVTAELTSLSYFDERIAVLPFRTNWYDSTAAFVALDTQRTKFFWQRVEQFRPRDSLGLAKAEDYRLKKRILAHDLNVLLLTADTTQ